MLRRLLRLILPTRPSVTNAGEPGEQDRVLLFARVAQPAEPKVQHNQLFSSELSVSESRQPLLNKRLKTLDLFHRVQCSSLSRCGVETAAHLLDQDPQQLSVQLTGDDRASRVLKRYQRAIRFAATFPGTTSHEAMTPREALLLFRVHRRSVRRLALESPGLLRRDLERFAMSSRGQQHLKGRRLPSISRIRHWIAQAGERSTVTTRAPRPPVATTAPDARREPSLPAA